MAQETLGVALPWSGIAAILAAGRLIHLVQILAHDGGVVAIFAIDSNFAPVRAQLRPAGHCSLGVGVGELEPVERWVLIDDACPAIDRHDRDDRALVVEREDLLCEGIQLVLISHDQQGGHLLIGDNLIATLAERGCLERVH